MGIPFEYLIVANFDFTNHYSDSAEDPLPDLLHYRLCPFHAHHFGTHNCIGA